MAKLDAPEEPPRTDPPPADDGATPGAMVCPYLRGAPTLLVSDKASCTHGQRPFKVHSGYQRVYCRTSRYDRCEVFTGQADQPLAPAGGGRRALPAPRPSRPRKRVVAVVSVLAGMITAGAVVFLASSGVLPERFRIDAFWTSDPAPSSATAEEAADSTPPVTADETPAAVTPSEQSESAPPESDQAETTDPPAVAPVDTEATAPAEPTPAQPESETPSEPSPSIMEPKPGLTPGPSPAFLADLYAFYAGYEALAAERAALIAPEEEPEPEPETPRDPRLPADAEPAEGVRVVQTGGGTGVRHRSDCDVDARLETGWLEGTTLQLLGEGVGRCAGWYFAEGSEVTAWIRADWVGIP